LQYLDGLSESLPDFGNQSGSIEAGQGQGFVSGPQPARSQPHDLFHVVVLV
jgi:hypothetical protein